MKMSPVLTVCLITLAQGIQQLPQMPTIVINPAMGVSSFHTNDGNACFEGAPDLAVAALATKRVAPYGSLINASYIRSGVRCTDEGYKLSVGEDDCYPGLHVFKKFELGFLAYRVGKRTTLNNYGKRYGLNNSFVERMVACTCHGNSHLRSLFKGNCSHLENMKSSLVSLDANNAATCEEGRFESLTRAAAMSGHPKSQVHPVKCKKMGFPDSKNLAEANASFVSTDGHACFEGPASIAGNALSLKKSSPYSLVFNGSFVRANRKCADDGFKFTVGKDDCYSGLHVFSKGQNRMMFYKYHKHNVLTAYSKLYKLPYSRVELMEACICHPMSNLRAQHSHQCGNIDHLNVSWVHTSLLGKSVCEQGPYETTTRAAVLLKNTGRVPVSPNFLNDHFAPVPCSEHFQQNLPTSFGR